VRVVSRSWATPEGATITRHRCTGWCSSRCDLRSPRKATATLSTESGTPNIDGLRSSVTPEGDRHPSTPEIEKTDPEVAILSRPDGRPPPVIAAR
jgi:hypothetical protein